IVAELWDCCGGWVGSIWYLTVHVHSPTIFASFACCGPGMPALVILSIMAFCSAVICGASAASAAVDTNRAATASKCLNFIEPSQVELRASAIPRAHHSLPPFPRARRSLLI